MRFSASLPSEDALKIAIENGLFDSENYHSDPDMSPRHALFISWRIQQLSPTAYALETVPKAEGMFPGSQTPVFITASEFAQTRVTRTMATPRITLTNKRPKM